MKKYRVLLFDLDDTLLDFQRNEYEALGTLFAALGYPLTDAIRRRYHDMNQAMWRAYERGELCREELLNTRFARLFRELGEEVDGPGAETIYRKALGEGAFLLDGALEVCTALHGRYRLCVVTNGVGHTQRKRLADSGLAPLFEQVFISEEIGCAKPGADFFRYVLAHLPGVEAGEMLLIGDSLTSDIQGGSDSGIDTCWLSRGGDAGALHPTYQIADLHELLPLLLPEGDGERP